MKRADILVALALAAWGCGVDDRPIVVIPDPIVVDDFEDMDTMPLDPRFGPWEHNIFGADTENRQFGTVTPGFQSDWAMRFAYQLTDAPDGVRDDPGIIIVTSALGAIDLTAYTHISLALRYTHEGPCAAQLDEVRVSITCNELNGLVEAHVPVSSTWQAVDIPFATLRGAEGSPLQLTVEDCLRVADGVALWGNGNEADGECASGTIDVDDVIVRAEPGVPPGGPDKAGDPGATCVGHPPRTPLIIGSTGSPAGPPAYGYTAPGLNALVVNVITAENGSIQALDVTADPGVASAPGANFAGFDLAFGNPACVDASAFAGVRFKVTGDLGTCALTFGLVTSEDNSVAFGPYGRCQASVCYGPSSGRLSTGTSVVSFADIGGGMPMSAVDPTALNGITWQLAVPTDGLTAPCVAHFTITDVAFVDSAEAGRVTFTFDDGIQGWSFNQYQGPTVTNLAVTARDGAPGPTLAFDPTDGEPSSGPGSLAITVRFTAVDQDVEPIVSFPRPHDLAGHTLHAWVRLAAGVLSSGSVTLYALTGASFVYARGTWLDSDALSAGDWVPLALDLDATGIVGFDPTQVVLIGLQFSSGSSVDGDVFVDSGADVVFEIDGVTD